MRFMDNTLAISLQLPVGLILGSTMQVKITVSRGFNVEREAHPKFSAPLVPPQVSLVPN